MTSYRGTRDSGDTDCNSPEFLDASVGGSTETERAEAVVLPAKAGSHREFLGRPALRLIWLPASIDPANFRS
jgi:hypothetical protein